MRRFLFLVSCLLCGNFLLLAQTPADIRSQTKDQSDGPAKVELLIKSAKQFTNSHPEDAVAFAKEALAVSRKLNRRDLGAQAYSNLGLVYMNLTQFANAIEPFKAATGLKSKLVKDNGRLSLSLAKDHRYLGICYDAQGSSQLALESYQQAVVYASQAKDWTELATSKNAVGEVQFKQQRYGDAFRAFRQALAYAQQANATALTLEIERNLTNTRTLLQQNEESEMELELFQKQLEVIQDSLSDAKEATLEKDEVVERLKMEQTATEAEIRAAKAEIEAKNKELEIQDAVQAKKDAEDRILYLAGASALVFLLLLLIGAISRSRRRKRNNLELAAEKQKSDDLLRNILPVSVANELKKKNKVTPVLHKEVSILFSDFKGFTSISSQLKPKELVDKLEEAFNEFDSIMEKFGLEKIKTIGDAYMAVAGLPNPDPHHAIHAVAAAMEMQEFMDSWLGKQKRRNEAVWELRIGINSGQVIAGVIGQKKFAYDIWGDAVNVASRMETSGEAGKVNISASTHSMVSGYCDFEPVRRIEIKNKGMADTYFVKDIVRAIPPYKAANPQRRTAARRR
ncbi:MAG: adenylate/guanylate cyclase domain-containing protein [Bacteroidota bacterium]